MRPHISFLFAILYRFTRVLSNLTHDAAKLTNDSHCLKRIHISSKSDTFMKLFPIMFILFILSNAAYSEKIFADTCETNGTKETIRIAVLYASSETGSRFRDGVYEAYNEFSDPNKDICLKDFPYDEGAGYDELKKIAQLKDGQQYHVILGPTDSDAYVDALERSVFTPSHEIPVISSVVTAEEGNDTDGWFFRTNIDIENRAHRMNDALLRLGYEQIVVLYEDSIYGLRAESAFSSDIGEKRRYQSFRYAKDLSDIRARLNDVLDIRPGTLGIFGQRHKIPRIVRELESMQSSWNAYSPLVFTLLDGRTTKTENLHFLSVVGMETENLNEDDVWGLSFDTTMFVLNKAKEIKIPINRLESWREALRKKIVSHLNGPPADPGKKTGMTFDIFKNDSALDLFVLSDDEVIKPSIPLPKWVEDLSRPKWIDSIFNHLHIIKRRFGSAPFWNLILVIVLTAVVSILDLKRTRRVSNKLMIRPAFMILIFLNVSSAITAFRFLLSRIPRNSAMGQYYWCTRDTIRICGTP